MFNLHFRLSIQAQAMRKLLQKTLFLLLLLHGMVDIHSLHAAPEKTGGEIRILSWNIKMLPRALAHLKHYPIRRAKLIPQVLKTDSIDVICFQEAFDKKAMRIITRALATEYPYHSGPANNKPGKLNSGVMMISRLPLKTLGETDFTTCEKEDCFARKGGLMAEVNKDGRCFQFLGTHCEAGGSRALKISQYYELKDLADKHYKKDAELFYLGDFNTRQTDTVLYPKLLEALDAENINLSGELLCTSDNVHCDMSKRHPNGSQKVIDFVLERKNEISPLKSTRMVRRYQLAYHKDHKDLSDHYAVYAVYSW